MGGNNSKDEEPGLHLTKEEERAVLSMFPNVYSKVMFHPLSSSQLSVLWKEYLSDNFLRILTCFLFSPNRKVISFERFTSLFLKLEVSTNEEKAETLMSIVQPAQGSEQKAVALDLIEEYITELMLSARKTMNTLRNTQMKSWTNLRMSADYGDLISFVNFITKDLESDNDRTVMRTYIERWLNSGGAVEDVTQYLMNALYNIRPNTKPFLPMPVCGECTETMLDFCHVVFLRRSLPADLRHQWRLLFATNCHGESWSTLVSCITRQGPTVLVVKDSEGAVFGAFAQASWSLSPTFYGDDSCFLFTLRPEMKRFDSTGYNKNFQYLNNNQTTLPNGLGLGGQFCYWGLWLDSEFGLGQVSESCSTFRDYAQMSGSKTFRVSALEVWGVGTPDLTPLELGERVDPSVKDSTVEAILQMAGIEMLGKVYREELNEDSD